MYNIMFASSSPVWASFFFILPSVRRRELFSMQVSGGGKCKHPQQTAGKRREASPEAVTESIPLTRENTAIS